MDKLKMATPDLTQANIEKLAALFPACVTEARGEDGRLKKAVNFELLRQLLSDVVLEGDEAYEFTWVGKKAAIVEANRPIRKTLRPCPAESVDWDTTENLYIEGDNLEVLKLLQESYLGKVKMIYIDPPYNTGNDFIYRDDFAMSGEEYSEESGQVDEETGDRLFKNTDSNGRFHSDWCSMIYSRLMLARNFLSDDGVICISIDRNELQRLQFICDEIFGMHNIITTITWEKGRKNDSTFYSDSVEYIVIYAKNINTLISCGVWRAKKGGIDEVLAYYEGLKKRGKSHTEIEKDMQAYYAGLAKDDVKRQMKHFYHSDDRGLFFGADISSASTSIPDYEIYHPITHKPVKKPSRGWGATEPVMLERIRNGRVLFGNDETTIPLKKSYLTEVDSIVKTPVIYKDGRAARKIVQGLLDGNYFENPKDHLVIEDLISYVLQENSEATILDFFSGSATTAHAVMQLNAEDGGHRKFIMVQLPEPCDEKSEAYKAGYLNICEIGKERIRRAAKKIAADNPDKPFDGGFRVFKLDDTNMTDVFYSAGEYDQSMLDQLVSNIKPDRTDLDLLFGCLLEWGLPLSMPYTSEQIEGCTVHTYNDGDLIACFDENIPDTVIKEIAKRQPLRAVFRDSSFADSPAKINVGEIFKMLAPDTRVKVI